MSSEKKINIFFNIFKSKNFLSIIRKIRNRLEPDTTLEAITWAKKNKIDLEFFCKSKNQKLWNECLIEFSIIKKDILLKLKAIPQKYNCMGNLPLIYFLVRYHQPEKIIETGVAAGCSSETILQAIKKNNKGFLYSSDLPYFKIDNPEKFIGSVVSNELKIFWKLDIRGDHFALDNFIDICNEIDFFHYDSDKSFRGRDFVIKKIKKYFKPNATLIMDDINDNLFFKNFVEKEKLEFNVLEFQGQYIGLVEKIGLQLEKNLKSKY